jgi:adenylate kinase
MSKQINNVENETVQIEEQERDTQVFTEDDMRSAYNEGQKAGYAAAVRQIRTSVNDYLNDLLVSIEVNSASNIKK